MVLTGMEEMTSSPAWLLSLHVGSLLPPLVTSRRKEYFRILLYSVLFHKDVIRYVWVFFLLLFLTFLTAVLV